MTVELSKNFNLKEFLVTKTGIKNDPSWQEHDQVVSNLQNLVTHVLQKARNTFGPMHINSGFRNAAVNKEVKGNPKSQHRIGQAADIEVNGVDNLELAHWIAKNTTFDQLILENYSGGNSGWVHVSYRAGNNRKQVLNAPNPKNGQYLPGLPSSTAAAIVSQGKAQVRAKAPIALAVTAGLLGVWLITRKK